MDNSPTDTYNVIEKNDIWEHRDITPMEKSQYWLAIQMVRHYSGVVRVRANHSHAFDNCRRPKGRQMRATIIYTLHRVHKGPYTL